MPMHAPVHRCERRADYKPKRAAECRADSVPLVQPEHLYAGTVGVADDHANTRTEPDIHIPAYSRTNT